MEIGDHPAITRAINGDPTEGDDRIWCRECDDLIDASNTCQAAGLDPHRAQCALCCDCEGCSEEAHSRMHDPATRKAVA